MANIAVVLTCHNRKVKTLECLDSLYHQSNAPAFETYLVDDGSTDGTAEAVRETFPQVRLIQGDGSLYWSGGMRRGLEEASRKDYDAYIWLNDDVILESDALSRLQQVAEEYPDSVIGGAMRDPVDQSVTYSGALRYDLHPFHFRKMVPSDELAMPADVLHGNFVWISSVAFSVVGNLANYLVHSGGDFDFCHRANRLGVSVLLAPGIFGECSRNQELPRQAGFLGLRRALSDKKLPFGMGIGMYRQMGGVLWPIWLLLYYVRCFCKGT